MASAPLPAPGSKYGPCTDLQCGHKDCACTRAMAAARCKHCDQAIGYEVHMYQLEAPALSLQGAAENWHHKLVHASCHERPTSPSRGEPPLRTDLPPPQPVPKARRSRRQR